MGAPQSTQLSKSFSVEMPRGNSSALIAKTSTSSPINLVPKRARIADFPTPGSPIKTVTEIWS